MKKIKGLKRLKTNKMMLILIPLLLIAAVFFGPVKNQIQMRSTIQGDLMFYVMANEDMQDTDIQKWYMKNYQKQGIHTFTKDDQEYILLSAGEQEIENMDIKIESVSGFEDNILVDGRIDIPTENIKQGLAYPHKVLRIEKDPRKVNLGTLNLLDPLRDSKSVATTSLDTAFLKEIDGDKAFITTFNQSYPDAVFILSETAKKEIAEFDIKKGNVIGVSIGHDDQQPYPVIENIRAIKNIAQRVEIKSIDVENQTAQVNISGELFDISYIKEIEQSMKALQEGSSYMAMLQNNGSNAVISEIIGV